MSDIYERLGRTIRTERARLGQTLEELAGNARMTPSFLGQIERGERKLSLATLEKLALALGLSPAELFGSNGNGANRKPSDRVAVLFNRLPAKRKALLLKILKVVLRDSR